MKNANFRLPLYLESSRNVLQKLNIYKYTNTNKILLLLLLLLPLILVILNGLFYKACNGILSHCSTADVFVKLTLVKAYCLPVLTY